MSIERHYFPGNNTPQGFFSYYKYILGQREANRIICVKGGPGTGKSTFMKRIGQRFAEQLFYRLITANHDRQTAERVEKPITCIHLPPQGDPLTIDSDLHLLGPSA